jgi:hypothetical protein
MSRAPDARRPVRTKVAAMGAAAALMAGVGVAAGGSAAAAPAPRAAVSTKASAVLAALARTAAAQPAKPRTGRYEYLETKDWSTDETDSGSGTTDRLGRDRRQFWIAGNGSGRIVDVSGGKVYAQRFGPGKLSAPEAYPTNPKALQKVLAKSHPAYGTYEWMVAVNDVWDGQIVSPKLESALLRMLIGKPQLRYRGMVTDLQGRRGLAISSDTFHNGRMRTTLIFDPATGGLLDFEQQPLTRVFRVKKSVDGFGETAWLAEGYTTSDRRTP